MRVSKRVVVAFGAAAALTFQTPVSAYIVKARQAAVARTVGHPPSYLADAFSDAGRGVLQADRWFGWRAAAPSPTLMDDVEDAAPGSSQALVNSTLGDLDLGYLGAKTAGGHDGSGVAPHGSPEAANASFVGGSGGNGGAGGGPGAGGIGVGAAHGVSGSHVADTSHQGSSGAPDVEHSVTPTPVGLGHVVFPGHPGVVIKEPGLGGPSNGGPPDLSVESPEPATLMFLGAGLAGLMARRVRRSRGGRGEPAIR